jgi:hypothetical protein
MKSMQKITIFLCLLLIAGCVEPFIPTTNEDKQLLVVEGLITDQPVKYVIKLSKSFPLGTTKNVLKPVTKCTVTISDDLGQVFTLKETASGTYKTDSTKFQGTIGRKYTLRINTGTTNDNLTYQSSPVEMKPVPQIDSIYYEKILINEATDFTLRTEGCQVLFDTHDPDNNCNFYRWKYSETWEFHLPPNFNNVTNSVCWITSNSGNINIKNASYLEEHRINRYPLNYISNQTDRLSVRYSMLVDQYSLNEDEFKYWEELQNTAGQIGGLYDITPANITGNIWCVENPKELVVGYFSASAKRSKRIFIKDYFSGLVNQYADCNLDTIYGGRPITDPNLNKTFWIVEDHSREIPAFRVTTDKKECADCTVRGTTKKPAFW